MADIINSALPFAFTALLTVNRWPHSRGFVQAKSQSIGRSFMLSSTWRSTSKRRSKWPSMTIKFGSTGPLTENYPDLFQGLECEDFEMIRPLLFTLKELKENLLRDYLQKSAQRVGKQAAERHKPTAILDLQANIDEAAEAILLAAAERIEGIHKDKNHFFHKGGGSGTNKVPLIQQKRGMSAVQAEAAYKEPHPRAQTSSHYGLCCASRATRQAQDALGSHPGPHSGSI